MTCLWPMPADDECLPPEWETLPDGIKERARALASRTMERLTGQRVGICPVTVRPCRRGHAHGCPSAYMPENPMHPVNWAGTWRNAHCGSYGCATACEVVLPAPVGQVDEVKVNGVVLDESDYEIQDGHILVWKGAGDCPFPFSQPLSKGTDEDGTMSVTYVNAHLPDEAGLMAMAQLAVEYGLACMGKGCRLPTGVTVVARQGITMTITPGSFPNGTTGIPEVDAYIMLWNPRGLRETPMVYSPDVQSHRVVRG
jgi:hypothetical protein